MSVLSATGAFLEGYNAPKKGMDPELYHSLVQDYLSLLSQMEVEETRLKTQVVTSYATMTASLMSAQANILGALAEEAKAKGMSAQAKAALMETIYKPYAELTAKTLLHQPPDGSMVTVEKGIGQAISSTMESFSRDSATEFSKNIDKKLVDGQADPKYVAALLGDSLTNSGFGQIANTAGEELNRGTEWSAQQQLSYAHGVTGQTEAAAIGLFKSMVNGIDEARAANGQAGLGLSEAEVARMAMAYVKPGNDRVMVQAGANDPERQRQYNAEMEANAVAFAEIQSEVDKLNIQGISPELKATVAQSMDGLNTLIQGGPGAYAGMVKDMDVGNDMTLAKQQIQNELYYLEQSLNPGDPLTMAYNKMSAVPGFHVWADTMGFNTSLRAAIYAGNHVQEAKVGLELIKSGVTDPIELKRAMRAKGVHVTAMGRALAPLVGRRTGLISRSALMGQKLRERMENSEGGLFTTIYNEMTDDQDLVDGKAWVDYIEDQISLEDRVRAEEIARAGSDLQDANGEDFAFRAGDEEVDEDVFGQLTEDELAAVQDEPGAEPPAPRPTGGSGGRPIPTPKDPNEVVFGERDAGEEVAVFFPTDPVGGRGNFRDMETPDGMTFREYEDGTVQIVNGQGLIEDGALLDSDNQSGRALVNEATRGVTTSAGVAGGEQVKTGEKSAVSTWKTPPMNSPPRNFPEALTESQPKPAPETAPETAPEPAPLPAPPPVETKKTLRKRLEDNLKGRKANRGASIEDVAAMDKGNASMGYNQAVSSWQA